MKNIARVEKLSKLFQFQNQNHKSVLKIQKSLVNFKIHLILWNHHHYGSRDDTKETKTKNNHREKEVGMNEI